MAGILTLTLNPTVDLSTSAPTVEPGRKLRCAEPVVEPGGGGVNVSRAIKTLGGESKALIATAGRTGDMLSTLMQNIGIWPLHVEIPGETRQSFAVIDETSGEQFRFVMPGPRWDEAHIRAVFDEVAENIGPGDLVVLSGSQPPGVGDDLPVHLNELARSKGARLIVDTSGPALERLVAGAHSPVQVLRLNEAEAISVAGREFVGRMGTTDLATKLVELEVAEVVIIARGADGSIMASEKGVWHCRPPDVPVQSKVGAGDSFVAAFTMALLRDEPLPIAHAHGTAAASAAVMTGSTELCRREDYTRLVRKCMSLPIT